MPDKHDHLTSQIDEAFKARTERMIAGHWASQRKIFDAGYRAGYAAALDDAGDDFIKQGKSINTKEDVNV